MSKRPKPDVAQNAIRVGRESTAPHEQPLPADVELAWAEWSKGIAKVDARMMLLLKAAFEAGVEVGGKAKKIRS